jgi:hypothetical protein
MRNQSFIYNLIILLSNIYFWGVSPLFATLLKEAELDEKSYTVVHFWNNKIKGGRSLGHAALQIIENDVETLYVSLYPADHTINTLAYFVNSKWQSYADDGPADHIVRLYSLDRNFMKNQFKRNQTTYTLGGNGNDSPFVDDINSRNCASLVRDLLNSGGLGELFQTQTSVLSFFRTIPASAETLSGVGLGIGGALLGAGSGLLRGIFTLKGPLKTAWEDATKTAKIFSDGPLHLASMNFSMINYGHKCGECLIVTPGNILSLAKDARFIEKRIFPSTKFWDGYPRKIENNNNIPRVLPFNQEMALSLNGVNQYAEISEISGTPFAVGKGSFTVEAWFKTTSLSDVKCIVRFGQASPHSDATVALQYGKIIFGCHSIGWSGCSGNLLLSDDKWHHIAYTRDGNIQTVYLDGIETGQDNKYDPNITSGYLRVGYNTPGSGPDDAYFPGYIKNVKFWDKARSLSEIQNDCDANNLALSNNLVAYWGFNEGDKDKAHNLVTDKYHLSLINAPAPIKL